MLPHKCMENTIWSLWTRITMLNNAINYALTVTVSGHVLIQFLTLFSFFPFPYNNNYTITQCRSTSSTHASLKCELVPTWQPGSSSSCSSSQSSLASPSSSSTLSHESMENIVRSSWMLIVAPNNAIDHAPTLSMEIYRTLKPLFPRSHPQTRSSPQHLLSYTRLPEDDLTGSRRPCIHIMHFAFTVFQFAFHQYAVVSTRVSPSRRSTLRVSQVISSLFMITVTPCSSVLYMFHPFHMPVQPRSLVV